MGGGEQQIFTIGRGLVTNASLVLMDEMPKGVSGMVRTGFQLSVRNW